MSNDANDAQKLRWESKMEARRLGLTPVVTHSVHGNVINVTPAKGGEVVAAEPAPKTEAKALPEPAKGDKPAKG